MPLVRLEVRNEYRLGDPELYKGALKKDDPKALLEGVAVAGLVGILRQLGDLAEFAADVFHDLHEQVTITAARGRKIMKRIQNIEAALPLVEKAIKGQTSHIHFSYVPGSECHVHLPQEKNLLLSSELPRFMMDSYEECRDPPRLYLLDKFDHAGGAGACMKRYSDPSYFKRVLATSEHQIPEHLPREKKVEKMKRKGLQFRNGEVPLAFYMSRHDSRMRFASQSINDLPDMRLNSEILSESTSPNSRTKENNVERPSDINPILVPGELEFREVSIPNLHVKDSGFDFSFQHGEPSISGLDDTSQNESLQEQSVPRSSSVTWDEKTEIIKPSSPRSCDDMLIDKIQDSESLNVNSQHLTLEHAKIQALNLEGINLTPGKPPVLLSGNHFDEVTSETDNYMDALNTLESETETEAEFQTKQELKSNSDFCFEGPESKTVSTQKLAMQNPDSSEVEALDMPETSLNYLSSEIILNLIPSDTSGQVPSHAADYVQTRRYVAMNDSSEISIHLITENKLSRGRNDETSFNHGSSEIISNFIPSDSSGQVSSHAADSVQTERYDEMHDSSENSIHLITQNKVSRVRNDETSLNYLPSEIISNFISSDSSGQVLSHAADSVQTERYAVNHDSSESSIHLITEKKVSRGRNDETSLNYGSSEIISNFIPSGSPGQVPSHVADFVQTDRYVVINDSSESSIHLITENKVSRGRNDVLSQELTTSHINAAPMASTEHASLSGMPSVQLWTNAGLFGVQPSKPPDLGALNASNKNSARGATYSGANYSSNTGNIKTVAGFDEDNVDALTSSVHGYRSNAQLSAGTYSEVQLNDPLKQHLFYHENDMNIQQALKVRLQRPLSLPQFDKTQEEPYISYDASPSKQYKAENNVWSEAPLIATSSSQLQNSLPSLSTKGISSSFSDLAQRFLANTQQRKSSLTNANTSISYGLSTANISKAEETSRLNNHEDMTSENAVRESYLQFAKETVTRESVEKTPSSFPQYSEQSSPPLEHMRISFQPMNSFEMSRMKLELSSDSLYENNDDHILPSFHLLQGRADQNSGSESDDDTFCMSCPYSSDDILSPLSFSNSELWEHDERNDDMDYELRDASYRISSTLPSISGSEHNSSKGISRGSKHVDDSIIAFESKPFVDLPRIDDLLSLRNKEGYCDFLSNNLIASEINSNNMPPPTPPFPMERTSNLLVSSEESVNNKDGINHLNDIETLRYLPKQQVQHASPRTPNISEQDQQKMDRHQKLKHHGDNQEADKSKELLHKIREEPQQHDQSKINKQAKQKTRSANGKELDEREELLHQIRNKSFNLRRTMTTLKTSPPRSNASATNGNVTAILEKATAIRQAFVGSAEGGDEDNWSDG